MKRDPFAVLAAVELRDEEGTSPWEVPSGFDMFLWVKAKRRHDATMLLLGCQCPRCRVDASDMLAGRRTVHP